jgi:hypothetical protein
LNKTLKRYFLYLCVQKRIMTYDRIKKHPGQLLSLTGFTLKKIEDFLPFFQEEWNDYCSRFTLTGKPGNRISYSRKNSKIPQNGDKLLFILSYLKNSPLQEYHGATFKMTRPQCNDRIHLPVEILRRTLKNPGELPDRNYERVKYIARKIENVLLDGTERPVQRPQASDRQKSCYSGKKLIA